MIETKKFKKGQIISNEGDFELWMYYIVSGRVGIYGGYNTEHRVVLTKDAVFSESLDFWSRSLAMEHLWHWKIPKLKSLLMIISRSSSMQNLSESWR